jgi:hypothetical protein
LGALLEIEAGGEKAFAGHVKLRPYTLAKVIRCEWKMQRFYQAQAFVPEHQADRKNEAWKLITERLGHPVWNLPVLCCNGKFESHMVIISYQPDRLAGLLFGLGSSCAKMGHHHLQIVCFPTCTGAKFSQYLSIHERSLVRKGLEESNAYPSG